MNLKCKSQFKKIPNNSKFHEELRVIFSTDSYFKLLHCYQEVNVNELIPEYPYKNHHYDWYIQELNTVIELHGRQHYQRTDFGSAGYDASLVNFKDMQKRDASKKEAAIENDIKYIEISYKLANKLTAKLVKELLFKDS